MLSCFCLFQRDFKRIIADRDEKENLVKNCPIFETMSDEQVALLVGVFFRTKYPLDLDPPPLIE